MDLFSDDLSSLIPDQLPDDAGPANDAPDNTGTAAGIPPLTNAQPTQTRLKKLYCSLKLRIGKFRIDIRIRITAMLLCIFCPRDFKEKEPHKYNGSQLIIGNNIFPISCLLTGNNASQVLLWDSLMKLLPPEMQNHQDTIIFRVAPGREILKIRLKDSTLVSLAPDSRLSLNPSFGTQTRHISLEGEATIQVYPYRNKALTIQNGQKQIITREALINITAYKQENYQVSVVSGSIYVHAGGQTAIPAPGDAIVQDYATGEIYTKTIDKESVISWQEKDCYMFADRKVNEVLNQLTRWYGVLIVAENARTGNHTYTGCIYKGNSLKNVLESLRQTDNIEFRFDKEGVIHVWLKE